MKISIIAAMAKNRVIGANGKIPWHLPIDLKRFKSLTWGKLVIMGRKTHESIGKELRGRVNVIITRQKYYDSLRCFVTDSIRDAVNLGYILRSKGKEVFFIGGAEIYRQALPLAERIYLTLIHEDFEGDAFFPELNLEEWRSVGRADLKENGLEFSFITLERKPRA